MIPSSNKLYTRYTICNTHTDTTYLFLYSDRKKVPTARLWIPRWFASNISIPEGATFSGRRKAIRGTGHEYQKREHEQQKKRKEKKKKREKRPLSFCPAVRPKIMV